MGRERAIRSFGNSEENMIKYRDREVDISYLATKVEYCIGMHNYFEENDKMYFFYELCSEGDLTDWLHKKPKDRCTEIEGRQIIIMWAEGINALHEANIVHRDIKPDNVLLKNGEPRICDFGTARI